MYNDHKHKSSDIVAIVLLHGRGSHTQNTKVTRTSLYVQARLDIATIFINLVGVVAAVAGEVSPG
jgi:hypothetical protein